MTTTIQGAAAALQRKIPAPRGVVNTYASRDGAGPFICVAIDPLYWNSICNVPSSYEGYRVIVEKREPTVGVCTTPNQWSYRQVF